MMKFIEWKQKPRGTYRYAANGLTADVWQIAGKGWLWSIYDGKETCIHGHEGNYQPTLDAACELALKAMKI